MEISDVKKREDYLHQDEYFMALASLTAMQSKDPNTQVGACIVSENNQLLGVGYNAMPDGCSDDLLPWSRSSDNPLKTKYMYCCHAEMNAILHSANVAGGTIYVTLFPCNECAKIIIQSKIKNVIYLCDKYRDLPAFIASRNLLEMAGIRTTQFISKRQEILIKLS